MSGFKLIATNILTALVTAAATSVFWVAAYQNGREERADGASAGHPMRHHQRGASAQPQARSERLRLALGPTGLALPVAGVRPAQLIDTFTQARAGGARVHDAIDIMAPTGTPVVAAAPGTVEKLFFSQGGGGITAYVRSPDHRWLYYYAHLNDYAPGLREGRPVRRGDPIGTVGSTGNANPAGPHLHFAILHMRPGDKWHQGTPINPYPLLARKRGGG
ncbi:M23 family metallopeptidase [Sphingomonas sp.]|uniref:M23 family metallopeptidase n=1 Tax=Sphingomonas sp. TaxID=28214 RepID=UPI002FC59F4E